jgi:Holliday junction resolvase RusA-like endonuclease
MNEQSKIIEQIKKLNLTGIGSDGVMEQVLDLEGISLKDLQKALDFCNEREISNPLHTIEFSVDGSPSGWNRAVKTRTHFYDPNVGTKAFIIEQFKNKVGDNFVPVGGEVSIQIVAYKPIPKSFPKYKKVLCELGVLLPTSKPDYDNIGGNIGDALNGILYKDDAQVTVGLVIKAYSFKPRLEILISYRMKNEV